MNFIHHVGNDGRSGAQSGVCQAVRTGDRPLGHVGAGVLGIEKRRAQQQDTGGLTGAYTIQPAHRRRRQRIARGVLAASQGLCHWGKRRGRIRRSGSGGSADGGSSGEGGGRTAVIWPRDGDEHRRHLGLGWRQGDGNPHSAATAMRTQNKKKKCPKHATAAASEG